MLDPRPNAASDLLALLSGVAQVAATDAQRLQMAAQMLGRANSADRATVMAAVEADIRDAIPVLAECLFRVRALTTRMERVARLGS
jgi:hypothetical protein